MTQQPFLLRDYYEELSRNRIPGRTYVHKFGRAPVINQADGFIAIWNGGGDYTGFDATSGDILETFSSNATDAGAKISSGIADGGSFTTLFDLSASFQAQATPVSVGDVVINDTNKSHGIVKSVDSETSLTVHRFCMTGRGSASFSVSDSYRIATPASTGLAVAQNVFLLDSDLGNETSEYVILDGVNSVDSVGTDYTRCSRTEGVIAGSGGINAGEITVRQKNSPLNIFCKMPIGDNNTLIAAYTIPKEFEGRLKYWKPMLSGKQNAISGVKMLVRQRGEVFRVIERTSVRATGTSNDGRPFDIPKNEMPPGTDIKITADTNTNATAVSAVLDILLYRL